MCTVCAHVNYTYLNTHRTGRGKERSGTCSKLQPKYVYIDVKGSSHEIPYYLYMYVHVASIVHVSAYMYIGTTLA